MNSAKLPDIKSLHKDQMCFCTLTVNNLERKLATSFKIKSKRTKYCWRKFKKILIHGKTSWIYGFKDLIMLQFQCDLENITLSEVSHLTIKKINGDSTYMKFLQCKVHRESGMMVVRVGEGTERSEHSVCFNRGTRGSSGHGWWWWLYSKVNILNATELYTEKWQKW